jgi:hypothetical protein
VMSISENYKYVKSNDDNNLSNGMAAHFLWWEVQLINFMTGQGDNLHSTFNIQFLKNGYWKYHD